jgi:hypothetical protein
MISRTVNNISKKEKMFKKIPIFLFFITLYPILTLYSRNPGEIPYQTVARPVLIGLGIAGILLISLNVIFKDNLKASVISAVIIFYFSSSGHVYRILQGYLFPNTNVNFHPFLFILETLLILLLASNAVWRKYIGKFNRGTIVGTLNVIALTILIYPAIVIINFWISAADDSKVPWTQALDDFDPRAELASTHPPDIYLIVLDGYARNDVLKDLYSFNNSSFIESLERRGFYIAQKSHSNYLQTPLSFASFLNSSYLNAVPNLAGKESINRLPLLELIEEGRVINDLLRNGYLLVTTESGFQFTELERSDRFLSPFSSSLSTFERFFLSTTVLTAFEEIDLPIKKKFTKYVPIPGYDTHRGNVLFSIDALKNEIPNMKGPKFVVIHIVSPHPPFVLDKNGDNITPDRPYLPGDGEAFGGNSLEYQRQYIEQVEFLNKEILKAIDEIIANSPIPPVIILQGDHGPGSLLRRDDITHTCVWERASILNAYYLPGVSQEVLYPEITPVNTFRVVLNSYFGTNYELIPDKVYFSPQAHPYDFTDVTEIANKPCEAAP